MSWFSFALGALLGGALGSAGGWFAHKMGELSRKQALEAECREFVKAAGRARDRARRETEEVEARVHRLRAEHEQCDDRIEKLRSALSAAEEELRERDSSLTSLDVTTNEKDTRISRLEEQVQSAEAHLLSVNQALEERTLAAERLEAGLNAARAAHAGCSESTSKLESEVDELERRLRERDMALVDGKPECLKRVPTNGHRDDLKTIRGLGAVLERELNGLGIFTYEQLAQLTPKDIDWVATRIHVFPGRIKKDRWIDQARRMHKGRM